MKRFLLVTIVLALSVTLTSCGGAKSLKTASSSVSAESAENKTEPIEHNGKTLYFNLNESKYEILDIKSDESGYAVIYVEKFSMPELSREESYLKIQLFDENGKFTCYGNTKYQILKDSFKEIENIIFSENSLSFKIKNGTYFEFNRKTAEMKSWHEHHIYDTYGTVIDYEVKQGANSALVFKYSDDDKSEYVIETKEDYDYNFEIALSNHCSDNSFFDKSNPAYNISCEVDVNKKTALISNTKITYNLDFANGTYSLNRSYSDDVLKASASAVSPDGTKKIFAADSGGAGDSIWCDAVIYDENRAHFISRFGSGMSAVFLDNGRFIISDVTKVILYDSQTLEKLPDLKGFKFNQIQSEQGIYPDKWILGLAADFENKILLAAVRDYTQLDEKVSVSVLVLDFDGNLIEEKTTDLKVFPFYNNHPELCKMKISDGKLLINGLKDEKNIVSVNYLN